MGYWVDQAHDGICASITSAAAALTALFQQLASAILIPTNRGNACVDTLLRAIDTFICTICELAHFPEIPVLQGVLRIAPIVCTCFAQLRSTLH